MAETEEIKKLSKVARALEELPIGDRKMVLGFLGEPGNGMLARAEAATRVAKVLHDLDETAARRVLGFVRDQLAQAQSST